MQCPLNRLTSGAEERLAGGKGTIHWRLLLFSHSVVSDSLQPHGLYVACQAPQAPLPMEFSRQECWSGLPLPSPRALTDLGIKPGSPALRTDSLLFEPPGKAMAPSNTRVEFEYVGPGGGRSSSLRPQLVAKGLFLCSGLPRTGAGETDKLGKHREHASPVECLPGSSPGADCPSVLPARRGAPFQVPVGRTWFHPHHQWFHPHYQPRERQGACGISTSGWSLAHDGTL